MTVAHLGSVVTVRPLTVLFDASSTARPGQRQPISCLQFVQAIWAQIWMAQQTPVAFVESWICWHFSVPPGKEELDRRVGP